MVRRQSVPAVSFKPVAWFNEVGKDDGTIAGGKGANLGEMTRAGIPVPPGFIVTAATYFHFLDQAGLRPQIESLLQELDPNNSEGLQRIANSIKSAIMGASLPAESALAIREAYRRLGGGPVAVRSSATAEDLPDASFAGQQSTFLNVEGEGAVLQAVQGCWASLFEPRAIFYRAEHGFDHLSIGIAVPVQRMVQSEVSGVLFTCEPVTSDKSKITIEAVYGLGEAIVSGEVTPDLYMINKADLRIIERTVAAQDWQLVRTSGDSDSGHPNARVPIPGAQRRRPKLSDAEIRELARLARQIEQHYGDPQDIEWAREGGRFYIVQSRPITTLSRHTQENGQNLESLVLLASGSPASPGIGAGPVRIILSANELDHVRPGDVMVTEMTTPDFVPAMRRAAAIVTDRGGRTCHAAIVSRELGVPCVVGTGNATSVLGHMSMVTVDGGAGKIYAGKLSLAAQPAVEEHTRGQTLDTVTRVYVNLADPERAEQISEMKVDGVGLLRAEFIIANYVKAHPRYLLDQGQGSVFTQRLAEGLTTFAKVFSPRPVVYRTTDFKTNEYRGLTGGAHYEGEEENPMLGYRGVSRYITDIEVFRLELEAIKRVRREYPNLWVMLPFVRTVEELARCKDIMEREGLRRSDDFKLWMMLEVPSNVFLLDKFLDVGIDGISIGSNDLTQLILGVDRDNERLSASFDERNPAVLLALRKIITTAKRRGVTCSICGQAPSDYPDLTEKLVRWGITSVSVNADAIYRTREIIADTEAKLSQRSPAAAGITT
jgi:pyruvate,water dikinase